MAQSQSLKSNGLGCPDAQIRAEKRKRNRFNDVSNDAKLLRDGFSGSSLWFPDEEVDPVSKNGAYHHLETKSKPETVERRRRLIGLNCPVFFPENPLKIVRGHMQYLYQEDGTPVLDCINNVCHVGHCHPAVVQAGQQQMAVLNTNTRYLHDAILDYAEDLLATFPGKLTRVFFVNSGTEANELALFLARVYTQQEDVISLKVAYHGHSKHLVEIGSYKHDGPGGKGPGDFCHVVDSPDVYRGKHRNEETAGEEYAKDVRDVIKELQQKDKGVSAFIAESILSCGGQIVPPKGYFENVYRYVHEAGGVCIADEVQVGFGRAGSHFWAFELQGVEPDIVTIGKPMGNGHPVAAVITSEKIANAFAKTKFRYFNTYGGNPVSAAVAQAVLDVIRLDGLQVNAKEVGDYILGKLLALKERHPLIGDVRGTGFMLGMELVKDRESLEPARREALELVSQMKRRHILLSVDGSLENVIKFKSPMCFSKENADTLVAQLDEVLGVLEKEEQ